MLGDYWWIVILCYSFITVTRSVHAPSQLPMCGDMQWIILDSDFLDTPCITDSLPDSRHYANEVRWHDLCWTIMQWNLVQDSTGIWAHTDRYVQLKWESNLAVFMASPLTFNGLQWSTGTWKSCTSHTAIYYHSNQSTASLYFTHRSQRRRENKYWSLV